jgi:general secretion pathway protein E
MRHGAFLCAPIRLVSSQNVGAARCGYGVTGPSIGGTLPSMMTRQATEIEVRENESSPGFLDWLVAQNTLSTVVAERVERVCSETSDRLAGVLLKLGLMSEVRLADSLAEYCRLPRMTNAQIPAQALSADLNEVFIKAREIVPLHIDASSIAIACWDALDDYIPRALSFATDRSVVRYVATRTEISRALDAFYGVSASSSAEATGDGLTEADEVDRLKDLASDAPVIRLVQRVINEAISARASDIHLEPSEQSLHVRLRVDGMLHELETQSKDLAASVVSRIKVMAGLNIAERRLPQDGRIRVSIQGKDIDFRVATSPTLQGESVVLRILDRQDVALDFDALGFDEDLKEVLREACGRPHGIVLVTGPTGSGKTTTLYAALKEINTPEKKILTVEDPVEYVLAGVNQVPIKPQIGLSFAHALRAFLRQDPDVLMVGEIRDRETAEIAIQAALTGHLLLSTLHTNTAAAAVTRLLDMGIDDYLLTSTLHVILAQRLVRRLCTECRETFLPTPDVFERFAVAEQPWYRARGCDRCKGSGFRGRTAIFEALRMTDAVRATILERGDAHEIERVAISGGLRTMLRHGLERVSAGITTIEEVLRVTSLT